MFNGTSDFQINGNATHFLFATEDGTIQGWSSGTSTVIAVNNFPNAVYKGLALGSAGGANYLYAANFRNATVDVFDKNFAPHSFGAGAFTDPHSPVRIRAVQRGQSRTMDKSPWPTPNRTPTNTMM